MSGINNTYGWGIRIVSAVCCRDALFQLFVQLVGPTQHLILAYQLAVYVTMYSLYHVNIYVISFVIE